MLHIAINGFGRIGRNFLRVLLQDKEALKKIKVTAINVGPARLESVAHMFKYDSVMGIYPGYVEMGNGILDINGHKIRIFNILDPKDIPWKDFNIDWVVDASGFFTSRERAQLHIEAGAKKVLITAPAKDEDITIIPGVNHDQFDANIHNIVSLGSCTTNAILPTVKVLHEVFRIKKGFMTTVHAYTNDQVLLDVEHRDLRRARAAAINIIPTSTGATKVLGKVMPALDGLIGGTSMRVPVAKVSLIDFAFEAKESMTIEKINNAFGHAAQTTLKDILGISFEPLVSTDYSGSNFSVVIDGLLTSTVGTMGKVFGWYDNEWGYSARLKDFLVIVS